MKAMIEDPGFNTLGERSSKWTVITHHGVKMSPTVKNTILHLDISHTSGANWHGELRYAPFPVAAGEIFTLSFDVRARHPFTFSVWLGQQNAPYKSLVAEENHFGEETMTPQWQTFTHRWKTNLSEEVARLNFVFGQIDNTVEIKNVVLTQFA